MRSFKRKCFRTRNYAIYKYDPTQVESSIESLAKGDRQQKIIMNGRKGQPAVQMSLLLD